MKKISIVLMVINSLAIPHSAIAMFTAMHNTPHMNPPYTLPSCPPRQYPTYDLKGAARKFRNKHANDPEYIHNDIKSENGEIIASGHTYIRSRNSTINLIEHYGYFDHSQLTTAIREDDIPLVKFLLQHGANLNKTIEIPCPFVEGSIVKEFLFTKFYPIELISSLEMAQYLEENGADLSLLFKNLDSPVIQKNPELQSYLQKQQASSIIKSTN